MAQQFIIGKIVCKIINGPCRADLFVSTEYAYEADFPLKFTLEDGTSLRFSPTAIRHKDESGHRFWMEGNIKDDNKKHGGKKGSPKRRCTMNYDTKHRSGNITIATLAYKK